MESEILLRGIGNFMANPDIKDTLTIIRAACERNADMLAAVYLFGSAARGDATQNSDLDIAILVAEKKRIAGLRFMLFAEFSRALKRNDIDIVILNTSSNLILQDDIIRCGVLIYEGDSDAREEYESRILHSGIDFRQQRKKVMGV